MVSKLKNKKVLITAGPTREYLDPVRFISNESSGKMGYALAEIFIKYGAKVALVSGPVPSSYSVSQENITAVKTADEMCNECLKHFTDCDIAVFSAAVADYKPKQKSDTKIKKQDGAISIDFVKNRDIAFEFSKIKKNSQLSIGFALETNNVLENASKKMNKKKFDAIVINSPNENEGFGYDTNKISILNKKGELKSYSLKPKSEVATDIIEQIMMML